MNNIEAPKNKIIILERQSDEEREQLEELARINGVINTGRTITGLPPFPFYEDDGTFLNVSTTRVIYVGEPDKTEGEKRK